MPKIQVSTEPIITPAQLMLITGYSFDKYLQNPDTVIRKLSISDQWKFYQDIEADDQVTTCINKITRGASALKWEIYQGDTDTKVQELVKVNFERLNRSGMIRNTIKNIVKTLAYGRQFIEVVWEFIDGAWHVTSLDTLPLEIFIYDATGKIGVQDRSHYTFSEIPEYKILNPRNNSNKRNNYGESLLSKSYWPVFFKKNAIQFMNAYLERDGMPWVIAEYDEQILNALFPELEAEEAANEITNLIKSKVADAILALPKGMQIKIENPAGQGTNANNYKMMIDLCNEAISRVWTGHTATTIATPGKLGSDQNANDGLDDVIDDAKEIVVETFNQLISWLVTINYSENVVLPFFQFYQEKDINLDLSTRDKTLFDQGVRPTKEYFSREYSIPENEFEIVDPSTAQSSGNMADTVIKAFMSPVIEEIKLGVVGDANELRNKVVAIAGNYDDVQIDYMIKKCLEWAQ